MGRLKHFAKKSTDIIRAEGGIVFAKKAAKYAYYRQFPHKKKRNVKDILFINGCGLPHPTRYRVDHQIEQLAAAGLTADSVPYEQLDPSALKYYQGFVFFRCPITDTVRDFIKQAKYFNKTCFFDIDDLVIDEKYTNQNKYVRDLTGPDRTLYDDGVRRMRETLELCEYGITTTERLQRELKDYMGEVLINRNTASDEMIFVSQKVLKTISKDTTKVTLGYFSGSITHNEDFELITPALVEIMKKHPNVYLKIAGILDIPGALEPFRARINTIGFMEWRLLPGEVATCDINLAPLTETIFNEAKSENKWTEAALVKVPTVASNFGAFRSAMEDGVTGVLVKKPEDWSRSLDMLISDEKVRTRLGEAAYQDVIKNHTTVSGAHRLAGFIRDKLRPSIGFILPTTDISGGVTVAFEHAEILRKNGWNVTFIDDIDRKALNQSMRRYPYRLDIPGYNVITGCKADMKSYFDTMVATLWTTVKRVKAYPEVAHRLYLVQNFETEFAPWGSGEGKTGANATYCDETGLRYITISLWCQKWLKEQFGKSARYASNGIHSRFYPYRARSFEGKIKVLIEGDSRSEYKNTDEAFRIVEKLDPAKYEVSYLSYRREPKPWYRVDHFYNRIAPEKVGEVYAKCDILIKTSLVESFSYPPLEMMATGGVSVVVPNGGNVEYLRDGENCLFYTQGDIDEGVAMVERLVEDAALRESLIRNGLKTAEKYEWQHIEQDILALYE